MNTQTIVIGLVALIVGGVGGYTLNTQPSTHTMSTGSEMQGTHHSGMEGDMGAMTATLEGKSGDEFDTAFLTEMIVHHEGAVAMAEAALQNAKHDEIKEMAKAIISAQTTEIMQMRDWQNAWYGQ